MLFTLALAATIIENNQNQHFSLDQELRINAGINEAKSFCFDTDALIFNQQYDIKVSFLGSIGIDMALFWQHEMESFNDIIQSYQPMDTKKLRFKLDQQQSIESTIKATQCFYVIGYQISRSSIQDPYPSGFNYYISMAVMVDDLNITYLSQYLIVILGSMVITYAIYMFRSVPQKLD